MNLSKTSSRTVNGLEMDGDNEQNPEPLLVEPILTRPAIDDEVPFTTQILMLPPSAAGIRLQQISEITGWYAFFIAKELLESSLGRRTTITGEDMCSAIKSTEPLVPIEPSELLSKTAISPEALARDTAHLLTKHYHQINDTCDANDIQSTLDALNYAYTTE